MHRTGLSPTLCIICYCGPIVYAAFFQYFPRGGQYAHPGICLLFLLPLCVPRKGLIDSMVFRYQCTGNQGAVSRVDLAVSVDICGKALGIRQRLIGYQIAGQQSIIGLFQDAITVYITDNHKKHLRDPLWDSKAIAAVTIGGARNFHVVFRGFVPIAQLAGQGIFYGNNITANGIGYIPRYYVNRFLCAANAQVIDKIMGFAIDLGLVEKI